MITSLNTKSFPVYPAFRKLIHISYRKDNLAAKQWPKLILPEKVKIIKTKNKLTVNRPDKMYGALFLYYYEEQFKVKYKYIIMKTRNKFHSLICFKG